MKPTLDFTDSVTVLTCADKAAFIFGVLGMTEAKTFAETLRDELRRAIRETLIDKATLVADTRCQTSQAMALAYGVFDEDEKPEATKRLLEIIHENGDFLDTGILGARVIFHVLTEAGESDLAWKMITRPEFPSYASFIRFGETTIPECFDLPGEGRYSHNHHMYCDIKNWFISAVAGLRFNPDGNDVSHVLIKPAFIGGLAFAEATYRAPAGEIFTRWERGEDGLTLTVRTPDAVTADVVLPDGTRLSHTGERTYRVGG